MRNGTIFVNIADKEPCDIASYENTQYKFVWCNKKSQNAILNNDSLYRNTSLKLN